ncbi:MAG: AgmX/PglI C-terminal domain-containing protein, partial [Deltaproteobacteria bacterium]|nr:AgmX/PglI C-terminal domain-containing protein [Deltaproteobacteria bacterium]
GVLAAVARGGGGSYLAWAPGQTVQAAAIAGLESTFGTSLRAATLELPAGLTDVAPTVLPTIRAGEEILVAARVTGEVQGDVVIRGLVAGQPYEQRYPLTLAVSSAAGNGFVPRLWASLAIDQLERGGRGEDRARVVALSQGYGVMSKETSLLVLESAAMFDAFSVDRGTPTQKWTGEDGVEEATAQGTIDYAPSPADAGGAGADKADLVGGGAPPASAPMNEEDAKESSAKRAQAVRLDDDEDSGRGFRSRRGGMIPMRRVWFRVPSVTRYDAVSPTIQHAIEQAEDELTANPDSRERHRALVQALAYAGELERAREIAARWLERDKLDPQALGYQADLLGRDGQRELALRTLAGLIDLDADRVELHERMVRAYEMAGRLSQACAHRISLTALAPKNMTVAGATMRCLRSVGRERDAQLIVRALPDDATRAAAEKAATVPALAPRIGGDLVVNARWEGNVDLDLSVVTPDGKRVSWMGGRTDVVVGDASSTDKEQLALKSLKRGNYLIEVTRGGASQGPIRGTLDITMLGTKRSLPFELLGSRAVVGRLAIALEERLEQVSDFGMVPSPPQAQVVISGISDQAAARVVRARAGIYRACYQRLLGADPSLAGRLDVSMVIDANGNVLNAMAGGSMGSGVSVCVQSNLQRLRFPAGVAQDLRFSMTFRTSN